MFPEDWGFKSTLLVGLVFASHIYSNLSLNNGVALAISEFYFVFMLCTYWKFYEDLIRNYLFIYLFIYLFNLFIYLFIYSFIHLSIHLFIHLKKCSYYHQISSIQEEDTLLSERKQLASDYQVSFVLPTSERRSQINSPLVAAVNKNIYQISE